MRQWLDSIWLVRWVADCRAELTWQRTDRTGQLPARVKRRVLRSYARRFGLDTLVETGSYLGDTVAALRREFARVYSIELSAELAQRAMRRFHRFSNVTILAGDSGSRLQEVVQDIHQPALFWLDGHYSGGFTARGSLDTPVVAELDTVLTHPVRGHVVLIDDAEWLDRELGGRGIELIRARILSAHPDWQVEVRNDIIRAHAAPGRTPA